MSSLIGGAPSREYVFSDSVLENRRLSSVDDRSLGNDLKGLHSVVYQRSELLVPFWTQFSEMIPITFLIRRLICARVPEFLGKVVYQTNSSGILSASFHNFHRKPNQFLHLVIWQCI
jgi:hypothetical protein